MIRITSARLLFGLALAGVIHSQAQASPLNPSRFTKDMSGLWAAAEECKNTVGNAEEYYSKPIKQYLVTLYPEGVPYWVLPTVSEPITDTDRCINVLEAKLSYYQGSMREFRKMNPSLLAPPIITARVIRPVETYTGPEERLYVVPIR
jgi:hypothetical protein